MPKRRVSVQSLPPTFLLLSDGGGCLVGRCCEKGKMLVFNQLVHFHYFEPPPSPPPQNTSYKLECMRLLHNLLAVKELHSVAHAGLCFCSG